MERYKSYFREAKMSLLYNKFKSTEFYTKGFRYFSFNFTFY